MAYDMRRAVRTESKEAAWNSGSRGDHEGTRDILSGPPLHLVVQPTLRLLDVAAGSG